MKAGLIFVFGILLMTGCASNSPKEVSIPVVAKQPKIVIPAKPKLPIALLKITDKPDKVIKAYAASIELLTGYNDQLLKLLKVYQS